MSDTAEVDPASKAAEIAAAFDGWINAAARTGRFPVRVWMLRRMRRSPFWCRCLLLLVATRG